MKSGMETWPSELKISSSAVHTVCPELSPGLNKGVTNYKKYNNSKKFYD